MQERLEPLFSPSLWPSEPTVESYALSPPVPQSANPVNATRWSPPPFPATTQPVPSEASASAFSPLSPLFNYHGSGTAANYEDVDHSAHEAVFVNSPSSSSLSLGLPFSSDPDSLVSVARRRHVEVQRRSEEKAALRELEELVGGGGEQLPTVATVNAPRRRQRERKRIKPNRLSVLEASAARIKLLEQQLHDAHRAHRVSEEQVRLMCDEMSGMLQRERQSLQWLDASRTLRGTALLGERMVMKLGDCRTGRLLDANAAFFKLTGFTPSGILQRVDSVLAGSDTPVGDLPLVRRRRRSNACSQAQTEWLPRPPSRQYPGSMRLLQELLAGKRETYRAPFRYRCLDVTYEVQATVWVVDAECVEQADGSKRRRPLTLAVVASMDEVVTVEDED